MFYLAARLAFPKRYKEGFTEGLEAATATLDDNTQVIEFERRFLAESEEPQDVAQIRLDYLWKLSTWMGNLYTWRILGQESEAEEFAKRIYTTTYFVDDPNDEELEGHKRDSLWDLGWYDYDQDFKFIETTPAGSHPNLNLDSKSVMWHDLQKFRDTFCHEIVHQLTTPGRDGLVFSLIPQLYPEKAHLPFEKITGFRIYQLPVGKIGPYLETFRYLDEASTELIANKLQERAGMFVFPPTYPDEDRPNNDATLALLQTVLDLSEISLDEFSSLHFRSDLQSLAGRITKVPLAAEPSELNRQGRVLYGLKILKALENPHLEENLQIINQLFSELVRQRSLRPITFLTP